MAKIKLKFADVMSLPQSCTSAAICNEYEGLSTQRKHVFMQFFKNERELKDNDNSNAVFVPADSSFKESEGFVELELTKEQLEKMTQYKEFNEVKYIYDLTDLSNSLKEAELLYVQNDSPLSFLDLFAQAYAFEEKYGHRSKHGTATGKTFFAYELRAMVPGYVPTKIYPHLAMLLMRILGMEKHALAVFAEKIGIGTYIRVVVLSRRYYPEGFEKKNHAHTTIVRNKINGRIKCLKADAEIPENCEITHRKGDLLNIQILPFGNKNTNLSASKNKFLKTANELKTALRNELERIGLSEKQGFYFKKIDEGEIPDTSLATHHAACVINDTLNYAEKMIEEFREKTALFGLIVSDEQIYEVYMSFYSKIKEFILQKKTAVFHMEYDAYVPKLDNEVHTIPMRYFFSLVAKYAKHAVYLNMAYFLWHLVRSLKELVQSVFGKHLPPLFDGEDMYTEVGIWEHTVYHLRPRLAKMREKLNRISLRRNNTSTRYDTSDEEFEAQYNEYMNNLVDSYLETEAKKEASWENVLADAESAEIRENNSQVFGEFPTSQTVLHFNDEVPEGEPFPFEMSEEEMEEKGLEFHTWEEDGKRKYPVFVDQESIYEGQLAFAIGSTE